MDNFEKLRELTELTKLPPYSSFPNIELYMDQVIDILSRSRTSLRDDDRLSPAMVNNYIKAEILPRAKGKKYSSEHLAHLALIIRLKQVLSVRDTGKLIKSNRLGKSDEDFFNAFAQRVNKSAEDLINSIADSEESPADIAMELAVQSYVNKIICEYMIDMIIADNSRNQEKADAERK